MGLTKVVVWLAPFTFTVAPLTKFVPFTVKVKAAPPVIALTGDKLVIVGTGLLTAKFEAAEVPPPGAGLTTVIESVPADAMSLAGMLAVSCVGLTRVVVRPEPFTCTPELPTKFVPLIVSVLAPPPAIALVGERLVTLGTGLRTVKFVVAVPPPGAPLTTVMGVVPPDATSPG